MREYLKIYPPWAWAWVAGSDSELVLQSCSIEHGQFLRKRYNYHVLVRMNVVHRMLELYRLHLQGRKVESFINKLDMDQFIKFNADHQKGLSPVSHSLFNLPVLQF